ncbi:MAG TPA: amino acid ABC transporter permease [Solirubrobacterales bacterium]|nr:amino acid ABC transporter permease [Solirubrobacterales bacterium]
MDQFLSQYFDFSFMFDRFDKVLDGFGHTMLLWAVAGALSLGWGLILALLRQLPGRAALPARLLAIAYIDAFRGIPLLLVIVLIAGGFGALSAGAAPPGPLPESIAVPHWFGQPSPFWYGAMAITITYGAYMAEVYRAGIEAVPEGQMEAARSLGMGHGQAMRHVIVPQAVRKVIPPLLNDMIALMKDTSIVAFISFNEVVLTGFDIQSKTFNSSALTLGALLFLIVTIPMARVVDWLIAREQARTRRGGRPTPTLQPLPTAGSGAGP